MKKSLELKHIPDDIIRAVNRDNWEHLWKNFMTTYEVDRETHKVDYLWDTDTTREFIKALLKSYDQTQKTKKIRETSVS